MIFKSVLRLGKSHDLIESALKSKNLEDYFLRFTITTSNANLALYLLIDNILWLHNIGILNLTKERSTKLNKASNKFWLFSNILCLIRDFYELANLLRNNDEEEEMNKYGSSARYKLDGNSGAYTVSRRNRDFNARQLLLKCVRHLRNKKNRPLLIDLTKNIFDLFLPLSSLDIIKLSPGSQGFFGLVSSILSLFIVWDSKFKLVP